MSFKTYSVEDLGQTEKAVTQNVERKSKKITLTKPKVSGNGVKPFKFFKFKYA
jgi:hypothetical protein